MFQGIKVDCDRENCCYFKLENSGKVVCYHPDKRHYMRDGSCPLYKAKFDASKRQALLERFK